MSSRAADVIEHIKDLYSITLFFRDNAVDDDFYNALDNILQMIEEFLEEGEVSEESAKEFINKIYGYVRSNPLTKFLAIYIRDYL